MDVNDWIEARTIFMCVAGSHAYGLNTPESDVDFRGVCIPPLQYIALRSFEQKDKWDDGADRVVFNIIKFVDLALKANPNILELLFMPDDCILKSTSLWEVIRKLGPAFLSKRAKHTYTGYAMSQLKRIKSHRSWLLNPPDHKPTREEFGLPEKRMSKEFYGALETLSASTAEHALADLGAEVESAVWRTFESERKWKSANREWEQYETWKKSRNPKRVELEKKYGYDTKHASHCIRLMIQGLEILTKGTLSVRLAPADRDLCKGVKEGGLTYDELIETCDEYINRFEEGYATSTLPHSPDLELIENALLGAFISGNMIDPKVSQGYKNIKDFSNGRKQTFEGGLAESGELSVGSPSREGV